MLLDWDDKKIKHELKSASIGKVSFGILHAILQNTSAKMIK